MHEVLSRLRSSAPSMPSSVFCSASPGAQLLGIAEARHDLGVQAAEHLGIAHGRASEPAARRWYFSVIFSLRAAAPPWAVGWG